MNNLVIATLVVFSFQLIIGVIVFWSAKEEPDKVGMEGFGLGFVISGSLGFMVFALILLFHQSFNLILGGVPQ